MLKLRLCIAFLIAGLIAVPANAVQTGAGDPSTVSGITVTWSGENTSTLGSSGVMDGLGGAGTAANHWSVATIYQSPSYRFSINQPGTATVTVTFSQPVDNPILHIERLGGWYRPVGSSFGEDTSTIWTLSTYAAAGTVGLPRLSGNSAFSVVGSTFRRAATSLFQDTNDCLTGSGTNGTACGSVPFTGNNITSLTFNVGWTGQNVPITEYDQMEAVWSFDGATVRIGKRTANGIGSFSFTGTNGAPSTSISTASTNPNCTSYANVTNHANSITITEGALPTGWVLTSVSWQALRDGNSVPLDIAATVSGNTVTVPDAFYSPGDQITCTYLDTNTAAALSVTKTNNVSTVTSGTQTTYTLVYSNAGPAPADGSVIQDTPSAGLTDCIVISCSGTNGASCPVSSGGSLSSPTTVTSFPAGSALTIAMRCDVT